MRQILIVMDTNNKYSVQIKESGKIINKTNYIYDDIFSYENKVDDYMQEDLLLVKQNEKVGIFDTWKMEVIIPIDYKEIVVEAHHSSYTYICTTEDDDIYMIDSNNKRVFRHPFSNLIYYGHFSDTNNYLYLFERTEKNSDDEIISTEIGIISIDGQVIITSTDKYKFLYKRRDNFIILTLTEGKLIPDEHPDRDKPYTKNMYENLQFKYEPDYSRHVEFDGSDGTDLYDIYSSNGNLLYDHVDNYEFLKV